MQMEVDPLHKNRGQRCERCPSDGICGWGPLAPIPSIFSTGGAMQSHGGSSSHSWLTALLWIQGVLSTLVLTRDAHEAWIYWLCVIADALGR